MQDEKSKQEVPKPEQNWENVLKFIGENKKIVFASDASDIYYIFGRNDQNKVNKIVTTKQIIEEISKATGKNAGIYMDYFNMVLFDQTSFPSLSFEEFKAEKIKENQTETEIKETFNNWNKGIDCDKLVEKMKEKKSVR